jgi:hypothetical protein
MDIFLEKPVDYATFGVYYRQLHKIIVDWENVVLNKETIVYKKG